MRELAYAIKYLRKRKWSSLMRVITLTSGLAIGMVLIAKITFDLSYDRWLPQAENLYQVQSLYTDKAGTDKAETTDYGHTLRPVAPTAVSEIPGVIAGTSMRESGDRVIFSGEERFEVKMISADTAFFSTLGLPLVSGKGNSLEHEDNVFLSESLARIIFGSIEAEGRTIFMDKSRIMPATVAGVFKDIPGNSHLEFNLVQGLGPYEANVWDRGDGFTGYVRLSPESDTEAVNKAIPEMMHRHMDMELQREMGYTFTAYLKPVLSLHSGDRETQQTILILSIFTILLLATVSLNYVLASVSSLASRTKRTAVFKCMGASSDDIFISSIWETVILVLISAASGLLLLYAGKDIIHGLTGVPFRNLFGSWQVTGYVLATVTVAAISGLVPARIFSSIPAMDIFRMHNPDRNGWKNVLLFVQIASSAFIIGFTGIATLQYRHIAALDPGYDLEHLAWCFVDNCSEADRTLIKDELKKCPEIERSAFSMDIPTRKFHGFQLIDPATKTTVATMRYTFADSDFIETAGIRLKAGQNIPDDISDPAPAIVNERTLKALGWEDNPVGKLLPDNGLTISGVCEDFTMGSIFIEQEPLCLIAYSKEGEFPSYLTVRYSELTANALTRTENILKGLLPDTDIVLHTYRDDLHESYRDTERFRNSVAAASAFMLLITLTGLLGYVANEMRRKRKETAIRKVNGATSTGIVAMMLKSISAISIPAIAAGLAGTFIASGLWLQNFPERISPGVLLHTVTGVLLLCLILACVALQTAKAATENPSANLRSE